ncbi:MAG: transglutaminaseTgpA domain-containing protein [Myxococcota bacterium]
MTLGRAYELGLGLAATLALLLVLLGGELPRPLWLAMLAPPVSVILRARGRAVPLSIGTALAILAFGWGLKAMLQNGLQALVVAGGITLVGVLAARILTRRTLEHDLQVMLVTLLMVFAGTILHTQLTYGPVFVGYAVAATWALVARQLVVGAEREASRAGGAPFERTLARRDIVTPAFLAATAGLSIALLLSTTLVFVLFPRLGIGSLGLLRRNRGELPQEVSLVGVPRASLGGGAVVARVRGVPYREFVRGLYLRGPVYDQLSRTGFGRSVVPPELSREGRYLARSKEQGGYEIFMQPIAGPLLLTLGPVRDARIIAGGSANPSHGLRLFRDGRGDRLIANRSLSGPIRYWVSGSIGRPGGRVEAIPEKLLEKFNNFPKLGLEMEPYLELPEGLDDRILALALELTRASSNTAEKAVALRGFLLETYEYSLVQPNADKADPLAGFLFEDRRGHCEYFATSYAVMLRSVGIPARVIGGLQGGRWDDSGEVVVFSTGNAHVWVEWYLEGVGWITDDASPAIASPPLRFTGLAAWLERMERSWDEYVVDYNLLYQVEIARRAAELFSGRRIGSFAEAGRLQWRKIAIGSLIGAIGIILAWWLVRTRRRRSAPEQREHPLAKAISDTLRRLDGEPVPVQHTLREAVSSHCERTGLDEHAEELLTRALAIYEAERFGGAKGRPTVHRRLARELSRLSGHQHARARLAGRG